MKIRTCFVSNSSTSSFIILDLMAKEALLEIMHKTAAKVKRGYDISHIKIFEIGSDELVNCDDDDGGLWFFYDYADLPQDISFEEFIKEHWMYDFIDEESEDYREGKKYYYITEIRKEYNARLENIEEYNKLKGHLFVVGDHNDYTFMQFINEDSIPPDYHYLTDADGNFVSCNLNAVYKHQG